MSGTSDERLLDEIRLVLTTHVKPSMASEAVDYETHLFRDLKLDSVQQLTLVVELENRFAICFDEGEEAGVETIRDVLRLVRRHREPT